MTLASMLLADFGEQGREQEELLGGRGDYPGETGLCGPVTAKEVVKKGHSGLI